MHLIAKEPEEMHPSHKPDFILPLDVRAKTYFLNTVLEY